LPAVQDANSVEKHDQSGEPDGTDDLSLRRKPSNGKSDEKNGADAEGKSANVDLADQVPNPDRKEYRKDRLRSDDVLRKLDHGGVSPTLKQSSTIASSVIAHGTLPREIARSRD
jgi:hypothetical protein